MGNGEGGSVGSRVKMTVDVGWADGRSISCVDHEKGVDIVKKNGEKK